MVVGSSDDKPAGFISIALMVSGGLAALMWITVLLRWCALTRNQGYVWLARRAVLVNQMASFVDGFGMETLEDWGQI